MISSDVVRDFLTDVAQQKTEKPAKVTFALLDGVRL